MRRRHLRLVPPAAVLVLATACGPFGGGGDFADHRPAQRSATATPSGQSIDDSPMAALLPYPSNSTPWTHNKTGELTLDDFLDNFFTADAQKSERKLMVQRGFRTAVRRGWIAQDESQADIWIITFKDSDGARSMYEGLTNSWKDQKDPVFSDPDINGTGQTDSSLDDLGNANAKVMSTVGDRVMYVRYYTAHTPSRSGVEALAAKQAARLG